jgi:hypothetical protein
MKTFLVCTAIILSVSLAETFGQCGRISLIGEFNGWDEDLFLDRNPVTPADFSIILTLTYDDDIDGNGVIEMKFRENGESSNNWGSTQFPSGTAILNGPNIPVPIGTYLITFNCSNLEYDFQSTCGAIGLIGEMSLWYSDEWMDRDTENPGHWTSMLKLTEASDVNGDGIVEMKFRENSDWASMWGSVDFPAGIGILSGPNIPVPLTSSGLTTDYRIMFNCETAVYNFTETCGQVSLIGEFSYWADDFLLQRDPDFPNLFSGIITLDANDDNDANGLIEMKFRENADWTINWGDSQFPSGTAFQNGANIPVPLDETGITTDYLVTFNCSTGNYNFVATSGPISIIGAFNGFSGDVPMNRDPESVNTWKLTRCWWENSDLKFRENKDWMMNWGNDEWPSGTGEWNGPNVPAIAGTYDVTFNAVSMAYNFTANPSVCGEIGIVGDFNDWGEEQWGYPTDIFMLRDPVYPNRFSIDYYFSESTGLLFRRNADPTYEDVWGGDLLCQTGVQNAEEILNITGGNYHITFDCNSGDYCFTFNGNSVIAANVFSMEIDGILDESEWEINQPIDRLIEGVPGNDPNQAWFGAVYTDSCLYIGVNILDGFLYIYDAVEFFVDGDNSDGNYDEHDVHFRCTGPVIEIITGPPGGIEIELGFVINPNGNGYSMEVAIPLEALGMEPLEGNVSGFDIFICDDDDGIPPAENRLAWNGDLENATITTGFGDLVFGSSVCGSISLYNEFLGDITLRSLTESPTTYVGTYEFDDDFDLIFRKDKSSNVYWGSPDFPEGNAVPGGPPIPAVEGRYRISFECQTGEYSFIPAPAGENVAFAYYTDDEPGIDGMLDEYDLQYHSDLLVVGNGPVNNVVNWGARWDMESVYIGVQVTDQAVLGNGSPWENDGIEFFIDGNNDKDGEYDGAYDTHIIMDALNLSVPWFRQDGVAVTDFDVQWVFTALGYNVELRMGWENFGFEPGRGRVMGWSLGNNDNDFNTGRDYETVWYGSENNWSQTTDMGDLQLADGPYYLSLPELTSKSGILVYPNPNSGSFSILVSGEKAGTEIRITVIDLTGKAVFSSYGKITGNITLFSLCMESVSPGLYILTLTNDKGNRKAEKIMVR